MTVAVLGRGPEGWERRTWDLVASGGIGPRIPAEPAALILEKLMAGRLAPGARPAAGALTLAEAEAGLHALGVLTERRSAPVAPIFPRAVRGFAGLPPAVRSLHEALGVRRFEGRADIDGPQGPLARAFAWLAGFPPPGRDVPVTVEIDADETREVWTRTFGGHRFRSVLTLKGGAVHERFGPAAFALGLAAEDGALAYPVRGARLFGRLPVPAALVPVSQTHESQDADGRFRFDVRIALRSRARIAHYRGWLVPVPDLVPVADDQP